MFGLEMAVSFLSSGVGPNAGIFGQFRTAHTLFFGLLKQSELVVGLKLSMCVVCKILLRVNGLECVQKQIVNAYNLMC